MLRRVTKIINAALLAWVAWVAVNALTVPIGFVGIKDQFRTALQNGDSVALRKLTSDPQDDRIGQALKARQVDKPTDLITRGGGYSTEISPRFLWTGESIGYHDVTVKAVDGSAVPFRLELVKGNVLFGGGWKIKSVSFEK